MPTAKAVLALFVSASLAAPASAQVRAAASIAGTAVPHVALSAPLAPSASMTIGAPNLSLPAYSLSPLAFAAPAAPAVLAAPAVAPSALSAPPEIAAAASPAALSAVVRAQASTLPGSAPDASIAARENWEAFWSGSAARHDSDGAVAASAAPSATTRLAAAAGILAPAASKFHALVAHAPPFLEAGAVLAGAYVANRGVQKLLGWFAAKKGMDRHQVAVIRLVSSVVLWTGAASAALIVGGAPHSVIATSLGAGGTILTLGLRDVLGNVIQGVHYLMTRPYPIGARVQVDDQIGTVADATLTAILIKKDDGSDVKIRHAALAFKTVIVLGNYTPKAALRLVLPAKPKFKGAIGSVFKSLDRRFWLAGAAFAALLAVPPFVPILAAGWAATVVHYALAGSIAWLTRRVALALTAAVDHVARANGWRPETTAIARLGVNAALWALGGGAALRLLGVTWTALGASVGLTTLGIGLASNNFFGSVVQGGEVLFSKPFKIGDTIKIGAFTGVVEDMTLSHVVIKLDGERHALVPYAVVRDAVLVVTPGK